jgi:hypothetical protein
MHDVGSGALPVLRRLGFAMALLGLVLSTLVYVGALFGFVTHAAWALHVGAMALALPVVLKAVVRAPWWPPRARWRAMLRDAPPWGERALQVALFHVDPSAPSLRVPTGRMFSAGWMLVYLLCALSFWPIPVARRVGDVEAPR